MVACCLRRIYEGEGGREQAQIFRAGPRACSALTQRRSAKISVPYLKKKLFSKYAVLCCTCLTDFTGISFDTVRKIALHCERKEKGSFFSILLLLLLRSRPPLSPPPPPPPSSLCANSVSKEKSEKRWCVEKRRRIFFRISNLVRRTFEGSCGVECGDFPSPLRSSGRLRRV